MIKKVVFFQILRFFNVSLCRKYYEFWCFLVFLVVFLALFGIFRSFLARLNREVTNFESRYLRDESTKSLQKKMRNITQARERGRDSGSGTPLFMDCMRVGKMFLDCFHMVSTPLGFSSPAKWILRDHSFHQDPDFWKKIKNSPIYSHFSEESGLDVIL